MDHTFSVYLHPDYIISAESNSLSPFRMHAFYLIKSDQFQLHILYDGFSHNTKNANFPPCY